MKRAVLILSCMAWHLFSFAAADKAATSVVNMNTIVRMANQQTIKERIERAGMRDFEAETGISIALTDEDEVIDVRHVIIIITQTLQTYKTSMRPSKGCSVGCHVPEELLFEVALKDDPAVLKFVKKQGLIKGYR